MRRTSPERAPQVQSSVIEKGDIKLDCDSRRLFINDNEINLTAREFELLEILIKNENKVYSRESLLKIVWGEDYPGDVRTVDVHVRRLREKIEANPSERSTFIPSGVWDITTTRSNTFRKVLKCLRVKYILHFIRV